MICVLLLYVRQYFFWSGSKLFFLILGINSEKSDGLNFFNLNEKQLRITVKKIITKLNMSTFIIFINAPT